MNQEHIDALVELTNLNRESFSMPVDTLNERLEALRTGSLEAIDLPRLCDEFLGVFNFKLPNAMHDKADRGFDDLVDGAYVEAWRDKYAPAVLALFAYADEHGKPVNHPNKRMVEAVANLQKTEDKTTVLWPETAAALMEFFESQKKEGALIDKAEAVKILERLKGDTVSEENERDAGRILLAIYSSFSPENVRTLRDGATEEVVEGMHVGRWDAVYVPAISAFVEECEATFGERFVNDSLNRDAERFLRAMRDITNEQGSGVSVY